jgi:hypothetical protein
MGKLPRFERIHWMALAGRLIALVAMLTLSQTDTAMLKRVKTVTGSKRCSTTGV